MQSFELSLHQSGERKAALSKEEDGKRERKKAGMISRERRKERKEESRHDLKREEGRRQA